MPIWRWPFLALLLWNIIWSTLHLQPKLASSMTRWNELVDCLRTFHGCELSLRTNLAVFTNITANAVSRLRPFCGCGGNSFSSASCTLPHFMRVKDYCDRWFNDLTFVGGITATVFITKKDFSFMGSILSMGGFVALGFIICSMIFGFSLGLVFPSVMVVFAAGSVLYSTSNVMHQYRTDQHVAAALSLFASVALLFFYILQVLMSLSSRD